MHWLKFPHEALTNISALTVKDAIYSNSPTIFKIGLVSEVGAISLINILLADVVMFLNLGKTMSAEQILATSKLILKDHRTKNLKPDDFKICFENAKKGYYGRSFDRVDGQIVFEWLNAYMDERMDLNEQLAIQLHSKQKKGIVNEIEINPEGQKKIIEILKSVAEKTEVVKKEKPKPVKSERDFFIQNCFNEHYKIWLKNPVKNVYGRFIEYNGKNINELEYAEIKLKDYEINKQ